VAHDRVTDRSDRSRATGGVFRVLDDAADSVEPALEADALGTVVGRRRHETVTDGGFIDSYGLRALTQLPLERTGTSLARESMRADLGAVRVAIEDGGSTRWCGREAESGYGQGGREQYRPSDSPFVRSSVSVHEISWRRTPGGPSRGSDKKKTIHEL
jgi:hypothetical protein